MPAHDGGGPPIGGLPTGHADLIDALSRRLLTDLAPVLPPGTRVALLGHPAHANVGDTAIWLGQLELVRRLGLELVWVSDEHHVDAARLRHLLGRDGVVLITGGGNFGDLWPTMEAVRNEVLASCRGMKVVQLPQSICFVDERRANATRELLHGHGDVTVFLRDPISVAYAREVLQIEPHLTTDVAVVLGALPRPCAPSLDVVYLRRSDKESIHWTVPDLGHRVHVGDWPAAETEWPGRLRALARIIDGGRRFGKLPGIGVALERQRARAFRPLADGVLALGVEHLSRGRVLVTDRLHAHLLATMLGLPNVVIDTNNAKVSGFVTTWTGGCSIVTMLDDPDELPKTVEEVVQRAH